jgi:GDP-4-dehydro-6-deoxy-D-mannose reductase
MVRAYWLLLGRGDPGRTYNAASGKATSIQEVIDAFLGRAARPIEVRQVPQRVRPVDVPMLVGDASRLRELTGWAPQIPLRQSIDDVLDDWRRHI